MTEEDIQKAIRKRFSTFGKKGPAKFTPTERSIRASKAAVARWEKVRLQGNDK